MSIKIDTLTPGTDVLLDFGNDNVEPATFLGLIGVGDDRRANFRSANGAGGTYDWEAYRYDGRWCYGSSAQRLRVDSIDPVVPSSPTPLVYVSIITHEDGHTDVEVLDSRPKQSFIDSVVESGAFARFQIREGYINGGDSASLYDELIENGRVI